MTKIEASMWRNDDDLLLRQPRAGIVIMLFIVLSLVASCTVSDSVGAKSRPDSPAPLPTRAQEVRFSNPGAGIELAGTLTLPSAAGPHPAVVLITGAGPQDRDETVAGHKIFRVLAEYLTGRGLAVLRYDDRGVGASAGDFATATLHDFAADARAAVTFLCGRPEIDRRRIGLAGHSEGGLVAPLVALSAPGEVAFLVLLASPGLPGEEVLYLQDAAEARVAGIDAARIERSRLRKQQIFSVLKEESDLDKAAVRLRVAMKSMPLTAEEQAQLAAGGLNLDRVIEQQIMLLNNAATRLFLIHDPLPILRRTTVPVLALTGERDLQVPPNENLPLVAKALADGVCPRFSVRQLAGLNHLFQTSKTGLPKEYAGIKETFAPMALEAIADWILIQMQELEQQKSR